MATEFQFTRRGFLWVALGTLAGACGTRREGAPASDATAATQDGTVLCGAPTGADIEGPYYVAGSLETATLGPGALTLRGAVMDARCQPLPGAMVDVWQADETGAYANDRYRAKQRAGSGRELPVPDHQAWELPQWAAVPPCAHPPEGFSAGLPVAHHAAVLPRRPVQRHRPVVRGSAPGVHGVRRGGSLRRGARARLALAAPRVETPLRRWAEARSCAGVHPETSAATGATTE